MVFSSDALSFSTKISRSDMISFNVFLILSSLISALEDWLALVSLTKGDSMSEGFKGDNGWTGMYPAGSPPPPFSWDPFGAWTGVDSEGWDEMVGCVSNDFNGDSGWIGWYPAGNPAMDAGSWDSRGFNGSSLVLLVIKPVGSDCLEDSNCFASSNDLGGSNGFKGSNGFNGSNGLSGSNDFIGSNGLYGEGVVEFEGFVVISMVLVAGDGSWSCR